MAGTVVETGAGSSFRVGDRVMALPLFPDGAQRVVPDERIYSVAPDMPAAEAAAFLIAFHTADYSLRHRARLVPGEVRLVNAGAEGVGSPAIQLGVAMGTRVIATAGGAGKSISADGWAPRWPSTTGRRISSSWSRRLRADAGRT